MKRSNRLVLLVGVFLAVLAFVAIAILIGGGSSMKQTTQVKTTDGRTVECVTYSGNLSCDWDHAR